MTTTMMDLGVEARTVAANLKPINNEIRKLNDQKIEVYERGLDARGWIAYAHWTDEYRADKLNFFEPATDHASAMLKDSYSFADSVLAALSASGFVIKREITVL